MSVHSRVLCRIVLAMACLLPLAASAQHMPMHDMPSAPALGADAAFGAHGRLWVVTAHDGHVWLRHSDDLGKTLSRPVPVNASAEAIAARRENAPKVAIGPDGQIYVSWAHPLGKHWSSSVRFARSLDGGKTFSAPVTVNDGPTFTTHSFNTLAVAGNGDIVIAWLDGRDMASAMAYAKPHKGLSLYYTWSGDGGKTFASNRRLMDHTCECCRIALARTPAGSIATLFRGIFGDNIRDHAFGVLRSGDQPLRWQRATYTHWQIAACPEQGPGLAIGDDGVRHAVWYEASHGPAIWYGQLDPGHPPRHLLKIGAAGASHADVAAHDDTVWVTWNQVDADGYQLMLRVSHDAGTRFAPAHAIATSKHAVDSPRLLVYNGNAYVAWNTLDGFRLIPAASP